MNRALLRNCVQGAVVVGFFVFLFTSHTSEAVTFTQLPTVGNALSVTGNVTATTKGFFIDDPLDPKNKILYHSNVESPDVKNIYDGIVVLDEHGEALVQLPDYFLALNKDFRYLATPIGQSMPDLHLSGEVGKRFFGIFGPIVFKISGGVAGGKISWQVTGIRHDPYILANPVIPEVAKSPDEHRDVGQYVCTECYAQ